MKKVVTVRLSDDEIRFIESLAHKGLNPSTVIRFCIDFVMMMKATKEFERLVGKLPKDKLV